MADLPEDRLTPKKPPFRFDGIDYFAPLEITQGTSHVKRYGCFFTCLSTGAIHIEIAHSLGMASIVPALGGFISICGCTG